MKMALFYFMDDWEYKKITAISVLHYCIVIAISNQQFSWKSVGAKVAYFQWKELNELK